jgi:hypothetical protein
MYTGEFTLRTHAYEFVHDIPAIDLLFGDRTTARALLEGTDARELFDAMNATNEPFWDDVADILLYR